MSPDFQSFRATPLDLDPYPHLVVPNFLPAVDLQAAIKDFPKLDMPGLFLPESLEYGPAFSDLLKQMEGPEMRALVGEKLGLDLSNAPTLATVRSCCQGKDGRIHPDSSFKLATLLLYLNEPWAPQGGRLRILRSGTNLEDYTAEVPPEGGLLICFKVQPNSWHGHHPYVGPRRYLMINYCGDPKLRDAEAARHRLSGRVKKLGRAFGIGRIPA